MSTIELIVKACNKCGESFPLNDFYRNASKPDGYVNRCKPCHRESVYAAQRARRAAMGEEAWLERGKESARRSRERTGNASGLRYNKGRTLAISRLIEAHRREYEFLLAVALREVGHVEPIGGNQ